MNQQDPEGPLNRAVQISMQREAALQGDREILRRWPDSASACGPPSRLAHEEGLLDTTLSFLTSWFFAHFNTIAL